MSHISFISAHCTWMMVHGHQYWTDTESSNLCTIPWARFYSLLSCKEKVSNSPLTNSLNTKCLFSAGTGRCPSWESACQGAWRLQWSTPRTYIKCQAGWQGIVIPLLDVGRYGQVPVFIWLSRTLSQKQTNKQQTKPNIVLTSEDHHPRLTCSL